MLRAGGGRNLTHAVLTKLAGTPLSPCANLAKRAVPSAHHVYRRDVLSSNLCVLRFTCPPTSLPEIVPKSSRHSSSVIATLENEMYQN
jgi:hypothetical protein